MGWGQGKSQRKARKASTQETKPSPSRMVLERLRDQASKQTRGKLYVVYVGRKPGVYSTWDECEIQVKKFSGAIFKSYPNSEAAIQAIDEALRQTARA